MSTQEASPPSAATAPASLAPAEIKEEDAIIATDPVNAEITIATDATIEPVATDAPLPPTPSAPATSTPQVPAAGLTKKDYDVMVRLVKYLTEYKDEE